MNLTVLLSLLIPSRLASGRTMNSVTDCRTNDHTKM